MYLFGSGVAEHLHNAVAGGAADDGIIDHNHALSIDCLLQDIQLYPDAGFPAALARLDKGTAHVTIFHKGGTVGDAGLKGIAEGRRIAGLGYAHHQVCLHRAVHGQESAGLNPRLIDADAVEMTVRAGKIDVFKDAAGLLILRKAMALIRFDAFLGRNCHDLTGLHVTHKGGADGIQGAGLAGQDVSVVALADA